MANAEKKEQRKKRMEFLKTNRPFAVFALTVIIILSFLVGMAKGVISLKNDVTEAYTDVSASEIDIKGNLSKMATSASHLLAIYKAQAGEDELYLESENALSALTDYLDSPFHKENSAKTLAECIYSVHYTLTSNYSLNYQVENSETAYYYDFDSKMKQLSKADKYNNAAREYNKAVSTFPLSLIINDSATVYE